MKSIDVKTNTYDDFGVENNDKDTSFIVGDYVRTLKYKNIFCNRLYSKLVRRSFIIRKAKILCDGHM